VVERAVQLVDRRRPERVADLGTVERDADRAVLDGAVVRDVAQVEPVDGYPRVGIEQLGDGQGVDLSFRRSLHAARASRTPRKLACRTRASYRRGRRGRATRATRPPEARSTVHPRSATTRNPRFPVDDAGSLPWRDETRYLRQYDA
jgi:hypothetical protein